MGDVFEKFVAKREKEAAKKAEKKGMYASRLEFAKDLLSEGESIERTVRLSKAFGSRGARACLQADSVTAH